jgi:hypothetical protein
VPPQYVLRQLAVGFFPLCRLHRDPFRPLAGPKGCISPLGDGARSPPTGRSAALYEPLAGKDLCRSAQGGSNATSIKSRGRRRMAPPRAWKYGRPCWSATVSSPSYDDDCIVVASTSSDYKWRMKKTHAVAIRMDPDIKSRLEELAKSDNRSLSSYVGLLLMRHVEEKGRKPKR